MNGNAIHNKEHKLMQESGKKLYKFGYISRLFNPCETQS